MRLAWLALIFAALVPRAASADDEISGGTRIAYSHEGQVGVQVALGAGYRAIFPYDGDDYCGRDAAVCYGMPPVTAEVGLSYGLSRSIELLVDVRLGITTDFQPSTSAADAPRPFAIDAGLRIYIDDSGSTKFFTSILAAIDRTDYSASGAAVSTDFGARNVNGLMIDLHRTFGFYLFFGETIGFVRWMSFEVDAGAGIQARFP
jgi:hypothetical protein